MIPTIDFETRSAAGYVWNEEEECWEGPPGAAESGLELVGVKNYVQHPTFRVLCLAYKLSREDGAKLWVPGMPNPRDLLRHVALRGVISGWNVAFEFEVWNSHCVPKFGWPPLILEQLRCDMATARAWALPGKLENAGEVLRLNVLKDKRGKDLIKKFTIPRQPTKKNQDIWNEPDGPDNPPPVKKPKRIIAGVNDPASCAEYEKRMQEWRDKGGIEDDIPF